MVSAKTLVAHLTVALAALLCSLDSTTGNRQCKNRVMEIVMSQCSGPGRRARRDLTEALPKIEPNTGAPPSYPRAIVPVTADPGSSQYYIAAPPPAPSMVVSADRGLPQASGVDLGFGVDLTSQEVDDLYDEISRRISRSSTKTPEERKKNILEAAAKCCQNEELCRKEQSIISCIW